MIARFILVVLLFFIYGCSTEGDSYKSKLIGSWKLDSAVISTLGKRKIEYKVISFKKDSSYYIHQDYGDVFLDIGGKYSVLSDSQNKHFVINLKDSINSEYKNLDVLLINDSSLNIAYQIKLRTESGLVKQFTQIEYYSK